MMRWRNALIVVIFSFALAVPVIHAQNEFEITPFGGSRFGGSIGEQSSALNPTVSYDDIRIKSSVDYGILADYTIFQTFPNLQAEFMWNRQPTELGGYDSLNNTVTKLTNANLDEFEWGILYSFRSPEAKIRPYAVGGLGFTHFSAGQLLGFSNRFSYNLGGGVKYFFTDHVGLRLEARWSPTHTTTGLATYCDPFYGCYQSTAANTAEQGQANVGVIFRFK
jgi:Outer membrane protein beta-barrel domain